MSALPLIALPGISPRRTGRKKPSPKISPKTNVAERAPEVAASPFSPFYGEKVPAGG